MKKTSTLAGMVILSLMGTAVAEHTPQHIEARHGSVAMSSQPIAVEGGYTAVLQVADDKNIDTELVGSFDWVTILPTAKGEWLMYVEGNTSPRNEGVVNQLGEANADAGSALDRDGKGRFQVSVLHYIHQLHDALFVSGLLDVSSVLDSSEVANDETAQFLSGPLVHNSTIAFPDYSLGAVYNRETGADSGYTFALTSSHGLADNPKASYAQLVDVTDDGKGVFFAAEGQWPLAGNKFHVGAWVNTADHMRLDGSAGSENNYGLYLSVDGHSAAGQWNVRAGLANEKVSQASRFLSAALERPLGKATMGLGIAYTGLSSDDITPELDDMVLAEAYLRFEARENMSVTPSIQWIENSGFDASGNTIDAEQTVLGLRVNQSF